MKLSLYIAPLVAAVGLATAAKAEMVTFDIDPAQSTLTLGGWLYLGSSNSVFGWAPQTTNSLIGQFDGVIKADRVGSNLAFAGESNIVGLAHPEGPFNPAGPGVDVFGAMTYALGGNSAANRFYDLALTLPSGSVEIGAAFTGPITYLPGSFAIAPWVGQDPISLAGATANNNPAAGVSLILDGDVETLTMPIKVFLPQYVGWWGVFTELTGTIVATRAIPEPATLSLLLLAAAFRRR